LLVVLIVTVMDWPAFDRCEYALWIRRAPNHHRADGL